VVFSFVLDKTAACKFHWSFTACLSALASFHRAQDTKLWTVVISVTLSSIGRPGPFCRYDVKEFVHLLSGLPNPPKPRALLKIFWTLVCSFQFLLYSVNSVIYGICSSLVISSFIFVQKGASHSVPHETHEFNVPSSYYFSWFTAVIQCLASKDLMDLYFCA
jgi:hypothetical protein